MSDFIAEARVVIRPDTTAFAAELQSQLRALTRTPVRIPVVADFSGAGSAAITAVSSSLGSLAAAQAAAQVSTLGLASAESVVNQAMARGIPIIETNAAVTAQLAGANAAAAASVNKHAISQAGLAKGAFASGLQLIGLRGATLAASGAFIAGAAATIAFGKSLSLFIDFERNLNVFQVTAGATADEMQRVSDTARELGRDISLPGVSASDAAETLTELARAGLSVQESLNAVRGTLQLATAAQIDNASATELVANALNAFKLPGEEAARVADLLAASSAESQGSILDMGLALRQVAPVAALLNVSVEDTITLLTQLARSGLSSSDAGTSLRVAFLRLVQDMPKVNKTIHELGLRLRDASGQVRPQVFGELATALAKLAPAARQSAIAALGGADAIRTFGLLARDGAAAFEETRAKVTQAGAAQELAAAQTKGLGGDIEALKNELSELGLTLGQVAAGPVSLFIRGMTEATAAVNDFIDAADETGVFEAIGDAIGDFGSSVARAAHSMQTGVRAAGDQEEAFSTLDAVTQKVTGSVNALTDAIENASAALSAKHPEAGRGLFLGPSEKLDIQAILAGGTEGLEDDLAAAQERLRRINARLQDFHGNRNQFADLMKEQAEAQADVTRILNQIATKKASAQAAAAAKLKSAQERADANLLAAFSLSRDQAQNRIALAEQTAGLKDDIRRQTELRDLALRQIAAINDRIKTLRLTGDRLLVFRQAIAVLRSIVLSVNDALDQLADAQEQAARERRQALLDAIDLDIELAQITENQDAEVRARLRKIRALQADLRKEAKLHGKTTLRYKEIRNEIARQRAALDDLAGESEGTTAAAFFFSQLQAQAGFVSNLLGNLIPKNQTAGLVGVPSAAAAAGKGLPPPGTGTVDIGFGADAAAAQGRALVSPTAGQASTTNEILRRILHQLQMLTRSTESPEAIFQEKMGAAIMSGGGGNTDVM